MAGVRDEILNRIVISIVFGIVGLGTLAKPALAEPVLLEIGANDQGDILEVYGGDGKPLKQAPFRSIEGFDLIVTKSLLLGIVEGEAGSCCKVSGRWYVCAEVEFEGISRKISIDDAGEIARVDGLIEGVWKENPRTDENVAPGGQAPINSAVIRSLKSHVLAVVEKEGTRYGMVISADGMWYGPEEFAPGP